MKRLVRVLRGWLFSDRLATDVFEHALDAIFVTDRHGTIVRVNPAFTRTTGYSAAEAIGGNPRMLQSGHHDTAFYQAFWRELAARGEWRGDIWNRRKNGEVYPEWLHVSCVRDARGQVRNYVAIFSDITERKRREALLAHQAHHDALTGLPNRLLFRDRLQQALAIARRDLDGLAVMFLDLDQFKRINDDHGHDVGDELLRQFAQRVRGAVREADTVARLSGDEFTVLLPQMASAECAVAVAEKILAATREPYLAGSIGLTLTSSLGISLFPADGDDADALMKRADAAMYLVKASGRAGCGVYGVLAEAARARHIGREDSALRA